MFSREQYEQLRSFPEISRAELFRYLARDEDRNRILNACVSQLGA